MRSTCRTRGIATAPTVSSVQSVGGDRIGRVGVAGTGGVGRRVRVPVRGRVVAVRGAGGVGRVGAHAWALGSGVNLRGSIITVKRKIEYWVIPPDQDAEFVADMENVLETYAEAYD